MMRHAVLRIIGLVPTLLLLVTAAFFVIRLAPGGPFDDERPALPEVRANLEAAYGLDAPLTTQYLRYVRGLLHGDLGPSFKHKDSSVSELIGAGLPISATLGAAALALALLLGIPLGVGAALRRGSLTDRAVALLAALAIALPTFVLGPLLALLFGVRLRWLPAAGWDAGTLRHAILPVVTLAIPVLAYVIRLTRTGLIEVLGLDYIRAARARGIGMRRLVVTHALRPALLPLVSWLGPATAFVLTGSLIVETVFSIPGAGRFLVEGALNRDYTLVMGMTLVYGTITLICNLLADLLYAWLDPRIRRH
ncbi:MAG TPA: ABC transporter permease subunit [Steroidobacteraceae bacterium]|nr:ABC transporter permease subunit [Steroidobacteraceae bacterium]HNS27168.1 ABC transporter permease subunit [Steroidobacteraceae bacterium]